jgi:GTPase SAR1 family protein
VNDPKINPDQYDSTTEHHWLVFENRCLKGSGEDFQQLFENIMVRAKPGFTRVRPYGNIGDRKCDGLFQDDSTFFQVYSPDELEQAKVQKKIDEDLDGAVAHWGEAIKTWIFVYNVRRGVAPDIIRETLPKKQEQYPSIKIRHWSNDYLWEIARGLPIQQRSEILGAPPQASVLVKTYEPINWQETCRELLKQWKELTTNALTTQNGVRFQLDDIFVPLGVVERQQRPIHRSNDGSPEQGSELYEEKVTPISQDDFFEQVLRQRQSKQSQGKRIAIIGEPGAGKTTQLQKIGDWILEETDEIPIWIPLAALEKKSLNEYLLKDWLQTATSELEIPQQYRDELGQLLKTKKVWLLLDGVDEMAVSDALHQIATQMKEGWLQHVRVVLTCRLNVWDTAKNDLYHFDVFRNLDFDYPGEVHQFIDNWFGVATEFKEKLKSALKQPQKARIRDMARNPLRLTLLCYSWQRMHGELPETKAGLYEWFVDAFYDWNKNKFPVNMDSTKRKELNHALGELAQKAIDQDSSCFRLRQKFINEFLGDADDQDSLFNVALKLGWLNRVGVAAENPLEDVYAFFHATFQEYFAALSLGENPSIISDLIRDQSQLKKWSYPLMMAISLSNHKTAAKLLTPIVEKYPIFAAELILEETTQFGDEKMSLPQSNECGRQIQEAMQAWVIGLKPLSQLITPLRADGRVCAIGVSSNGSFLEFAWYMGTEDKEAVSDLPTNYDDFHSDWWGGSCRRGNEPAWAWRWTLDELTSSLWSRIDVARFAVENVELSHEAAWNAALAIFRLLRLGTWSPIEIAISAIEPKLKEIEQENVIHCGILWGGANPSDSEHDYYFRKLRLEIDKLQDSGETVIRNPWPTPDLNKFKSHVNFYSIDQLKNRIEKVYKAALDAYQILTQTWFQPLLPGLHIAVKLPAQLIGVIYPKQVYYDEINDPSILKNYKPEFRWFLQPLPRDRKNEVWIKIAEKYPDDEFEQKFKTEINLQKLRPEMLSGTRQIFNGKNHLEDELFFNTPAAALIFRWLQKDLENSKWKSYFSHKRKMFS